MRCLGNGVREIWDIFLATMFFILFVLLMFLIYILVKWFWSVGESFFLLKFLLGFIVLRIKKFGCVVSFLISALFFLGSVIERSGLSIEFKCSSIEFFVSESLFISRILLLCMVLIKGLFFYVNGVVVLFLFIIFCCLDVFVGLKLFMKLFVSVCWW